MKIVIYLLKKKLGIYKRSKYKSIVSYVIGDIDEETHRTHLTNLNKLIDEFTHAIEILENV